MKMHWTYRGEEGTLYSCGRCNTDIYFHSVSRGKLPAVFECSGLKCIRCIREQHRCLGGMEKDLPSVWPHECQAEYYAKHGSIPFEIPFPEWYINGRLPPPNKPKKRKN